MKSLFRHAVAVNLFAGFLVVLGLVFVPAVVNDSVVIRVFTLANLFALLAASWDLLSGFTGQVTFGHAAFVGIGGFTTALISSRSGLAPEVTLVAGTAMAALFGLIVGIPALRLQGPYLALATLAASSAVYQLLFVFKAHTGGEDGISGLSTLDESRLLGRLGQGMADLVTGGAFQDMKPLARGAYANYYAVLVITVIAFGFLLWVGYGKRGLVLRSIGQDETAAEAAGIAISRYKLGAFVLSSACAGLVGSLIVLTRGSAGVDLLLVDLSLVVIVMAALGGTGTLIGPVLGAYLVIFLQEYLLDQIPLVEQQLAIKPLVFAILLLVILRVQPAGLLGPLQEWQRRQSSRRTASRPVVADPSDVEPVGLERTAP